MTELKIGIIGASRVATYAMLAPSQNIADVRVTAIAARNFSRAVSFGAEHGIPRSCEDYGALVSDPEIDLVYISTPPSTHAKLALEAIGAGKHVLVEKPFAMGVEEARQVHEAGLVAGVQVFEAMHSPHHNLFKRVMEIIRSGEIGTIKRMAATFNAPIAKEDPFRWNVTLGGGALMDLGVYPLAWVRRIAGEDFEVVRARVQMQNGVDARFAATLRFANSIDCDISSSMKANVAASRLLIDGDIGTVEVSNPIAPQMGHSLTVFNGSDTREECVDGPSSYEAQLVAVRDACLGRSQFLFSDTDYIDSMAAIEQVRAGFSA